MKRPAVAASKFLLVLILLALIVAFFLLHLDRYLTLQAIHERQDAIRQLFVASPAMTVGVFFLIYVAVTALSLPGATIMTLAAGAFFGLAIGTIVVSFASTLGALLAFLVARFLLRDEIQKKFGERIQAVNEGIRKEGAFYLFTLRLIPAVPFFVINLVLGLTPMRALTFALVSQIGMLAGTIVYVNAGTRLGQLTSLSGILSPNLLASFVLLGIFPWFAKRLVAVYRARRLLARFPKQKKFDYDMVVIGAGSAGLVTAYISAAVKAKVALIEKHKMGGDCLNTGCVPSKALIRSARLARDLRLAAEFGMRADPGEFDFARVMDRVQRIVKEIEPHDSIERYSGLGVECIQGTARIVTPFEVEVNGRRLFTRNITIATGASPILPKISGLEQVPHWTSETLWGLREQPKRLLVLGGGPIGCELAQAFRRLGSDVTLVERGERLLPREDVDVSAWLKEKFVSEGIVVLTSHELARCESKRDLGGDGRHQAVCAPLDGGAATNVPVDGVIIALGRKANTRGFGLEELGITTTTSGTIESDAYLTTIYPNIFVAGDVAGPFQFTHTASHQAWYAAVNALFRPFRRFKADYRVIPWCTFTDPEIARVGLNEQDARSRGTAYLVSRYGIDDLDRAICEGDAEGYIKVLTIPGTDRILGVTIVGPHAGDIIAEFVLAMKHGIGLNKILSTIHIYPTFAEANKFAAGVWKRQTAPQWALQLLTRYQKVRRTFW